MDELAEILTAEQGKTIADARGDVFRGLEVVEHAAGIANLQIGDFVENVASGVDTYSIWQPLGVCAGITPFNFPAMIPLWMFPMAIATGNTFILKPSEQDPMVTMRLVELAIEAGVPEGVLNVVHGGKATVDAICDHPDIKAVSFVGSTHVGKHVYERASKSGKRAQCMMGAKNHGVILPDANKEQTLNQLAGAAFGAAGQRCMALSVVVLVGAAGEWIDDIKAKAESLVVSAGKNDKDLGPLISPAAKARVEHLIGTGVEEGASLILDGRGITVEGFEKGNFVGPTIFDNVTATCKFINKKSLGLCFVSCVLTAWMKRLSYSMPIHMAMVRLSLLSQGQPRINSNKTFRSVKSVLTCRFLCHYRCSHFQAHALVSLVIWVLMASKLYSSILRPRPLRHAGLMMKRAAVSIPPFRFNRGAVI